MIGGGGVRTPLVIHGLAKAQPQLAISEFALFPPTGSFTKVEQRIPVQITVANPNGLLKPGMMVVIGIVKD